MPASFLEVIELFDWVWAGIAGWRYLVSPSFRRETHERWKRQSAGRVFLDIACGIAGVAFTLVVLYVIVSLFAGWAAGAGRFHR